MKTVSAKKEEVQHEWYLVDATDKILGRLATQIANVLRGKNKPIFTPHVDTGDFIIVTNAEKIKLTGKKLENKRYYRHSGYPGGFRVRTAQEVLKKKPEDLIMLAVKGMLPKNRLGSKLLTKLKVYAGKAHPHEAQQPKALELKEV
jgi:large subunit ribosomal protein L13